MNTRLTHTDESQTSTRGPTPKPGPVHTRGRQGQRVRQRIRRGQQDDRVLRRRGRLERLHERVRGGGAGDLGAGGGRGVPHLLRRDAGADDHPGMSA